MRHTIQGATFFLKLLKYRQNVKVKIVSMLTGKNNFLCSMLNALL